GGDGGVPLRVRLSQMMRIRGGAVTGNFRKNSRAPATRMVVALERENGRAFAQAESVALRVEGPAARGRERLERIKAGEHEVARGIVTAREHALGVAVAHQRPGVTDGVGARRAGVADDGDRAVAAEGFAEIQSLSLCLVLHDARGLPAKMSWLVP